MSGLILPDVPYEEKEEFDVILKKYGLDLISMIAPTSHQRIQTIAKDATGFIYCVSSLGVTGVRSTITTDISAMVHLVREVTDVPVEVGFGISTPEQKKMADQSNGAIVKIVEKYGKDAPKYVEEYVKEMVQSIK
uniref:tryptophan synthase subunit alpha n=1 Tax=Holdemanella porci TaxID=2652276 RepID=UPI003FF13AB8